MPDTAAPERDYGTPEPRPAPVEFERPAESWSPPPEPTYRDAPPEPTYRDVPQEPSYRDAPQQSSAAERSSEPEPAPASSDERQIG